MTELLSFFNSTSLATIAFILFGVYALVTAIFLIMENRSPESTLAWMLLLLLIPILGVIIYLFFGRGYKAFSKEEELVRQELGGRLTGRLSELAAKQETIIEQMQTEKELRYKHKLVQLVRQNSNAMLTANNRIEILQDAAEKYPRLLADIEAANHSVHMEYFSWAADSFTEKIKTLLLQKARAGVAVRILVDAYSFNRLDRRYIRDLREGGVEIYGYLNYLSLFKIHNISYRNHRKAIWEA